MNPTEYFAEAFNCYIKENAKMKNIAPLTYSFIEYYIGKVIQD